VHELRPASLCRVLQHVHVVPSPRKPRRGLPNAVKRTSQSTPMIHHMISTNHDISNFAHFLAQHELTRIVSLGCGEAPLEFLLLRHAHAHAHAAEQISSITLVDFANVLQLSLFAFEADDDVRISTVMHEKVRLIDVDSHSAEVLEAARGATVLLCFGSFRHSDDWQRVASVAESVLVVEDGVSCDPSVEDVSLFLKGWTRVDLADECCPLSVHGVTTLASLFKKPSV
jgi:hypothetical protein